MVVEIKMTSSLKRKIVIGAVLGLLVIGLIVGAVGPSKRALGDQPAASPDVEGVQGEQKDVPIYGDWIGTLDGLVNADVRAQVTGYLQKQGYQEGASVKQGQLLFRLIRDHFRRRSIKLKGSWHRRKPRSPTTRRCKA